MSTRDRSRQQSFRTRLLSWAGTAPQRAPSQRQPSRVTTTPSPEAQDQPPLPPQPRQQLPLPGAQAPPPARRPTQPPPSMGTAPSKPASESRSPATARAPPSPPPTDAAPPRTQPPSRTPSRQLSRTYTRSPSPSGPLSKSQAAVPSGPSPSPTVSPAQPAFPSEPKAPTTTPTQAPTPPPAPSTAPSPPAKAPSPQPQPAPVLEIPAEPPMLPPPTTAPGSPATEVREVQSPPKEQKEQTKEEEEEEETPTTPAKVQLPETSQEKDIDLALMPTELQKRPVPEAADKTISTESPTIPQPAPETRPEKTEDQLPPTKEVDQKQTSDTTETPKPEPDQDSVPTLPKDVERKVDKTEGEKRTVDQPELVQEEDLSRSKTIETKPEEFKEETPTIRPVPTPDEQPQIKESQETTTMVEAKQTTDEKPQAKDSQETTNMVGTKQISQEPYQQPIQMHTQPIREVKLSEAEQPEKQPPPPEKEPAAPPIVTKGKEGKIAVSTISRKSTSSREQQSDGLHKEIKEGISRLVQSLAVQHTKQTGDGHDISIITLAGDNHGASMYVGYSTTAREGSNVHVHRGPLPNGGVGASATGEDEQKKTDQQSSTENPTSSTSVNSNVQTINNSILQDSCCSEENPGVHLVISTKPPELAQQQETAKPAQPQKHRTRLPLLPLRGAHEPDVRRRCLRALFLEPSDDDAEKPQRPRRHGCRFSCGDEKNAKGKQDGTTGGRDA